MFDSEARRLVTIFQDVFNLGDCEPDRAKYVKRHAGFIETTGRLFEYLSLAELDKESPLGWRPTPVLLYLMNEQARKSTPSRKSISMQGKLLMSFLDDAAFDAESDRSCALGYEVLRELGLLREDWEGEYAPTRRLLWLFDHAYYTRLARSRGCPYVPTDYGRLVEGLRRPGR
jgi:hypothetical protein